MTVIAWILTNRRTVALGLAVAAVLGFVGLSLHWKHQAALEHARADAAVAQAQAAQRALDSQARHDAAVQATTQQVQAETEILRKLPNAQKPLDPAERAALCASLNRMRHTTTACHP